MVNVTKQPAIRARRKLTPAAVSAICERVRGGSLLGAACALEGVTTEALRLARRADDDIAAQVEAALAVLEEIHRTHLAAAEDWRAHHQILRALNRETWGEPREQAGDGAVTVNVSLTVEQERAQLAARARELAVVDAEVLALLGDGKRQ